MSNEMKKGDYKRLVFTGWEGNLVLFQINIPAYSCTGWKEFENSQSEETLERGTWWPFNLQSL